MLFYLLVVGCLVGLIATMAGIGSGILLVPLLILFTELDYKVIVLVALAIELVAFSSGLIEYYREEVINFQLAKQMLMYTIPGVIFGVLIAGVVHETVFRAILLSLLFILGYSYLSVTKRCIPKHPLITGISEISRVRLKKSIHVLSFVGGSLVGIISAGLGEINEYIFLNKVGLTVPESSGTSLFIVASTACFGIITHSIEFCIEQGMHVLVNILGLIAYLGVGAFLGAKMGVYFASKINPEGLEETLGIIFLFLAIALIARYIFN